MGIEGKIDDLQDRLEAVETGLDSFYNTLEAALTKRVRDSLYESAAKKADEEFEERILQYRHAWENHKYSSEIIEKNAANIRANYHNGDRAWTIDLELKRLVRYRMAELADKLADMLMPSV